MDLVHRIKRVFKPSITINLRNGDAVGYRKTVTGRVHPHHSLVQIIVKSRDGKFYLQKDATLHGHHWTVDCTFGFENDPLSLHDYDVTVFVGEKQKVSPLDYQPATEAAVTRTVRRVA